MRRHTGTITLHCTALVPDSVKKLRCYMAADVYSCRHVVVCACAHIMSTHRDERNKLYCGLGRLLCRMMLDDIALPARFGTYSPPKKHSLAQGHAITL